MTAVMLINTILTFDALSGYEPHQTFYDIPVEIHADQTDWQQLLNDQFFPIVHDICTYGYGAPQHLLKISTSANWSTFRAVTGADGLVGHNGKWDFGNGRTDLNAWDNELMKNYGFGSDIDVSWMNAEEPMEEWLRRWEAQAA